MTNFTETDFASLAEQALVRCHTLATFTQEPGQLTRLFLSPPMRDVHSQLEGWAAALGLETSIDAAGNWHAVRHSADLEARTLLIASHLDTVPNAGAYDGPLGVVLGLGLLEALGDLAVPYHLHVVGFSEEEGVRFGVPFLGSRALVGTAEPLLELTDAAGVTVRQAIGDYGLDVSALSEARLRGEVLGYLEFHIEQGPVLEADGRALGAVSAVAGQSRFNLAFTGKANHAGTTPMHLRRDALTGAAEFILAAETQARQTPGLVATVGFIEARPGASNVIPGAAHFTLDVRHAEDEVRRRAQTELLETAGRIAAARHLSLKQEVRMEVSATPMDGVLTGLLGEALEAEGHGGSTLVSGAGHDAMVTGTVWPSTMLFVRSPGGISHHPDETVLAEDVEAALRVGVRFLTLLAEREEGR
ncbi:allantoate amidohydrolase [Deinococcus hopiensis]|uniref:Allantoate deiminase n=1 Tax=Deinococcus hopiensis KR-140 TaxID=695939 RepID=A0A1W1UII7_9DEIO|nr:allantoate amidohydrolase [Deinococcus hopiensis]SMB80584.1 allantoate deiminase [Deinococcus hopiensis KR-140]